MMRPLLAAALLLSSLPAAAGPMPAQPDAKAGRRYVTAWVRSSIPGRWDISDNMGRVWLNVSSFGGSVSFNGRPVSGSLFGSSNWYSISAGGLSGSINKWGGGLQVNANAFGPQGSRQLWFNINANGPIDGAGRLPSLSMFGADGSLSFNPGFGDREYQVSGWVDETRFGDEGVALACLASVLVLKDRPQQKHAPRADFLERSRVAAPALRGVLP